MLNATFTIFTIGFLSFGTLTWAAETTATANNNGNTAAQIVAQAQAAAAQDGQNKRSGASQALDAAALASKALCSTLTLAAMAEKDPQKKQEKKDMAMLACMQAAANQKAGDENKDSANALNGLTPQFGGYQAPTVKEPTNSSDDNDLPLYSDNSGGGSNKNPYDGMIDIPEITVPDLSGGGKKDGTLTASGPNDGKGAVAPGEGFTALSPIDPSGLTYELGDEAAKKAAGGFGAVNAGAKPAELPATQASPANQVATIGAPPSMRGLAKEAGAGGEEAAAAGGGADGAFDTLMAQLMGGGPADGMMAGGFGGGFSDIRFMTNNPASGPRMNIFQFASQNYSQANSQARVLTRSQRTRQLASVKP